MEAQHSHPPHGVKETKFITNSHSDALVFFGATGDLAYKKILPSLQATDSSRLQESSGSAQCIVPKVNARIRKLLSTIEAHLVSPARNREWTAHVAMPAAEDPLEDGL